LRIANIRKKYQELRFFFRLAICSMILFEENRFDSEYITSRSISKLLAALWPILATSFQKSCLLESGAIKVTCVLATETVNVTLNKIITRKYFTIAIP